MGARDNFQNQGKPSAVKRLLAGHIKPAAERAAPSIADHDLRSVIDGMSEGFALLDADFTIIDVNAETMRLETRSREEIIGRTHWEVYPGSEE